MTRAEQLTYAVVVICWNQERYIAETLESVLLQSAGARISEIVVVDDRSDDRSFDIIRRYATLDPRIRAVRHQRNSGGCAGPRNTGIALTSARFIAFLDGDDLWLPNKVEEDLRHLAANPAIGLLFSDFTLFDDKSGAERPIRAVHYSAGDKDQLQRFFVLGGPVIPSGAVVSRAAIDVVGAFDVDMRFNEDSEFWNRIASVAPLHGTRQCLVRKREWFGSLGSAQYGLENIACKHEITRRMVDRVPQLASVAARRGSGIELKTAVYHFGQGDIARARTHLKRSLLLDPGNRKARLYLAISRLPGTPEVWLKGLRRVRHGLAGRAR